MPRTYRRAKYTLVGKEDQTYEVETPDGKAIGTVGRFLARLRRGRIQLRFGELRLRWRRGRGRRLVSDTTLRIDSPGYEMFIAAMCLLSVVLLVLQLSTLTPAAATVAHGVDLGLCAIFAADFLRSLVKSAAPLRYFYTWGWLDLLSAIPSFGGARVVRLLRVFRLFRGFRSAYEVVLSLRQSRRQITMGAVAIATGFLASLASVVILQAEAGAEGANIKTVADAVWWSYVTITTVGYGDRFPVTTEGRLIAAALMTAGIALYGVFVALVATYLLSKPEEEPKPAPKLPVDPYYDDVQRLYDAGAITALEKANLMRQHFGLDPFAPSTADEGLRSW